MDFLRSDLLSWRAKLRLLGEPFISSPQKEEESIAQFIRRRLGKEPLDYAVNPFVSGVYAGDPERLSIRHTFSLLSDLEQEYGSITKGLLKRSKKKDVAERALISFDKGLQLLPETIAERLGDALHLHAEVQQISSEADGWDIKLQRGNDTFERRHHKLISALPLPQLAAIWDGQRSKQAFGALPNVEYASVSVLALGFRRKQVGHPLDGFGALIPEKEPFSLLGCLFSSSLFMGRAPEDHVLLTCFIGGSRHPGLAAHSTESLMAEVLPQLRHLLGIDGQPVFHHHRYWPQGIPQYNVGYDHYLQLMSQIEAKNSSFFLAGNYRGGVSVPDCMVNGFEAAAKVAAR
jgi:oxygen-dependent protoporphyrinogen oxidase